MNKNEDTYLQSLHKILKEGEVRDDRTGVGTISLFGLHTEYNIDLEAFPLLTSKKMFWKGIVGELLWFLRGETNIKWLQENGINIWNQWASEDGELGSVYGHQWRHFPKVSNGELDGEIDQISEVVNSIKNDPNSRRHIVTAWNPGMIHEMALPPCHAFFQFYVRENKYLDCQLYQRSNDYLLGIPFNIASYSLLTAIIAMKTGYEPGKFYHCAGDAHVYQNHVEQVIEQIYNREVHEPPKVWIDPLVKDLDWDQLELHHFKLENYKHSGSLKAEIAV